MMLATATDEDMVHEAVKRLFFCVPTARDKVYHVLTNVISYEYLL